MRTENIISLLYCSIVVFICLVAVSLLDILIAVCYARFYNDAVFAVTFGVAGVFATVLAYMGAMERIKEKTAMAKWCLLIWIIALGILFYLLLSRLEGGEYEVPFKAFGLMMAITTILFFKFKLAE